MVGCSIKTQGKPLGLSLSMVPVLVLLLMEHTTQPVLVQNALLLLDCRIVPFDLLRQSVVFAPSAVYLKLLLPNLLL